MRKFKLIILTFFVAFIQFELLDVQALIIDNSLYKSISCIENKSNTHKISCEQPMPDLRLEKNSMIKKKKMDDWKSNTQLYLENYYGSNIVSVVEDAEKVSFLFSSNTVQKDIETVEKVEYYKNEVISQIGVEDITTNQVIIPPESGGGNTKITYLSYWPNGVEAIFQDSKYASNMTQASYVMIALIMTYYLTSLESLVIQIANYVLLPNIPSLPVTVDVKAAIQYNRVVGSYYVSISNSWIGNVQIGRQKAWLYRTLYRANYAGGPSIPYHYDNIPVSPYQSGYDLDIKRPHYTDIAWILNKSYALGSAGNGEIYYDAY